MLLSTAKRGDLPGLDNVDLTNRYPFLSPAFISGFDARHFLHESRGDFLLYQILKQSGIRLSTLPVAFAYQ